MIEEQKNDHTAQPLSKKERAEVRRIEKEKVQQEERRARKIKKISRWVLALIIVAGLAYGILEMAKRSNEARPGDHHAIEGREHIAPGEEHEEYNTNPPTSGAHGNPVPWGVYEEELLDENLVHNLEHGGIWISYKDLNGEDIEQLRSIAKQYPRSVILTPRNLNDTSIAVASWGRLMKLDSVDEERIIDYIKQNTNKSPEPLAR